MSGVPTECPRCRGGRMQQGLLLDFDQSGIASEQQWMDGVAERSIWTGLKTKGHERFKVFTYRCGRCGYLESYANEQADD